MNKLEHKTAEFTKTAVVLGALLAVLFGGANAYLGLRVGMTVSASIPAAVISMGIIRILLKKESILENNMVQTIGSAGESLAAGAIFTMPALFMWAEELGQEPPGFFEISLVALSGGLLGIFFMVPLRKMLVVNEMEALPYPEGTACAKVLMAADNATECITVFAGLLIGALYKFIADGLKIFPSQIDYTLKRYKGAGIGADVLPALLGVGYICGARVASYIFAGGILSWFVIMPLLVLVGENVILYPATVIMSDLDTWGIWSNYIRYIGAGAVATGGIISLIKSFPLLIKTFLDTIRNYGKKGKEDGSEELSSKILIIGTMILAIILWILPAAKLNFVGVFFVIVFGFFFATVSSRMVGLVGSSNNPVSGMAIATLLVATYMLKRIGNTGITGMIAAICIGTVICIISAMAGDTSQDLKTGYLVGATPIKQQIGEIIGTIVAALTIGGVLYLLNAAWGYGSTELPAPQATLMKMVVEGVMNGNLPWNLVLVGVAISILMAILKIPVLPFAVGMYLPIHLSVPIMIGGLLGLIYKNRENRIKERGILYASGLIAGEGLVGILLAIFAMIPYGETSFLENINMSSYISLGNIGGIVFFATLIGTMVYFMERNVK